MSEKKDFIPIVTINNKRDTKVVEIDGVQQEVELPAQEGFNIEKKELDGSYSKKFFTKKLSGVILFDRYKIESKYNVGDRYYSNEFEFSGKRNNVKVWSSADKKLLYSDDYSGAKEFFATGETTKSGTPAKTFDVYLILYFMVEGQVLRFKWKLNQNNNWFSYKDNSRKNKESREDTADYREILTDFALSKKKFGSNEFWICNLQSVGKNNRKEADLVAETLIEEMDKQYKKETPMDIIPGAKEVEEDSINVNEIPF